MKSRYLFSVCCALLLITAWDAQAQYPSGTGNTNTTLSPLITDMPNREKVCLDGAWHYIIDPYNAGYLNYRYRVMSNSFFRHHQAADSSELVEYNFQTSPVLQVPGDWNTQSDTLLYYEGTVWYARTFDYHKQANKRVFLYFGAVNYDAMVGLNGKVLGRHTGGFTPFDFEVTDQLKEGKNFIVVKVNDQRDIAGVPTNNLDWWNYGGITRSVYLVETPTTFVRDYAIHLDDLQDKSISGWVQLDGPHRRQTVALHIPELKKTIDVQTNDSGFGAFSFADKDLQLWAPEHPKRYALTWTTDEAALKDQVGFRRIATSGDQIVLNGQPIFLRGVSIHEEAPGKKGGRITDVSQDSTLLQWAKQMHCNFVRLAHYPHNEQMVRLAERMGLLVWSEIPVYWTIDWNNDSTLHNALNQLTEEITRDKNRANIILWSVGNETPLVEGRLSFLRSLIRRARALDDTRLITSALQVTAHQGHTFVLGDSLGLYLDVLGCNTYPGWYGKPPSPDRVYKTPFNKPLIMSEFGAGAVQGLHGSDQQRWTEEFQNRVFKADIAMLKNIPFLRGTTPWILKDFRSPRRMLPHFQEGWNKKGLISTEGKKKEAFHTMQQFYQQIEEGQVVLDQ